MISEQKIAEVKQKAYEEGKKLFELLYKKFGKEAPFKVLLWCHKIADLTELGKKEEAIQYLSGIYISVQAKWEPELLMEILNSKENWEDYIMSFLEGLATLPEDWEV